MTLTKQMDDTGPASLSLEQGWAQDMGKSHRCVRDGPGVCEVQESGMEEIRTPEGVPFEAFHPPTLPP